MIDAEVRIYPCITPRAWRLLGAIRWSRGQDCDVMTALEWSLEIARQAAHLELAGKSPSSVVDYYSIEFAGSLRLEHAALGEAAPVEFITEDDLPEDLALKIRYLARTTRRLPPDVVEWAAELAASTMCDRRTAEALHLATL